MFVLRLLGAAALAGALAAGSASAQAVRSGFAANALERADDPLYDAQDLGFTLNFFGTSYSQVFVNNNGNVTFGEAYDDYTPYDLTGSTARPIIAPFFADVDTRNPLSAMTAWSTGTVDGRAAFGATWPGVGYFSQQADKLNVFQLILIDRSDTGAGNFDFEFNYDRILWETGYADGGTDGFGGTSARAGYSNGSGTAGTYHEFAGSGVHGALLDGGANALTGGSNVGLDGRYVFQVRNGTVAPPVVTPEPATVALMATGLLAVGGVAARRRRAVTA